LIDPLTLFWLTSFSLGYLLFTSIILLRNRISFTPLYSETNPPENAPTVSVCVPARNEEDTLERLIRSVADQSYEELELLVIDDFSTDKTPDIIERMKKQYPNRVKSVEPSEKPDNWLGKPWACQQLGNQASGSILLFLDADTALYPGMVQHIVNAMHYRRLDMITVWPEQELKSFWEKTVIPLIYYALVTLLPADYVYRAPRWMPSFLRKQVEPAFAAACGQCIGFTRDAYETIGGHRSVRQQIVEDVALAKRAKRKGLIMRMYTGVHTIRCRMYRSQKEIFSGLRKNFFAGFDRSIPLFILMAFVHIIVFILPFISLPYAIYLQNPAMIFISTGSVTLILLHRFILSIWFRWNPLYGFLHPLGVLWFQRLGVVSIIDHFMGRKVAWKDRRV
jgi:chlorobactene glucosyltransferase